MLRQIRKNKEKVFFSVCFSFLSSCVLEERTTRARERTKKSKQEIYKTRKSKETKVNEAKDEEN